MIPKNSYSGKRAYLIILGLLILCACVKKQPTRRSSQINALENATGLSAQYLMKSVDETGMFTYRINMDSTIGVKNKYNILRHAGAIYSMVMYCQLNPDADMMIAINRAGKYLQVESIRPLPAKDDIFAVWSDPMINQSGKPLQAKLGGTGIGLVALLSIEKIHPGFTPLSDLQALGRFIVFMQKENGSFYSKYIPSMGGRMDKWRSLYYPGEAALGLLMLYDIDPANDWMQSAAKALQYLAHSREHSTTVPADHWALLATEKILAIASHNELPVSKKLLINHAIQICESMVQDQIRRPERTEYDGGFSKDGRTTPSATRLEGLQAALNFLPPDDEIRKRIDDAVSRGISFLLRAQITEGKFIGAFPRAAGKIDQDLPNADTFNRRRTEVRIDYVHHALSAMIQYLHFMKGIGNEQ